MATSNIFHLPSNIVYPSFTVPLGYSSIPDPTSYIRHHTSSETKTTCFAIVQIAFTMVKDTFFKGKTTCFTLSDSSDR